MIALWAWYTYKSKWDKNKSEINLYLGQTQVSDSIEIYKIKI